MNLEHKKRWIAGVAGVILLFGTYYLLRHLGLVLLTVAISAASFYEFTKFSGAERSRAWISVITATLLCAWLSFELPGGLLAIYLAALAILLRGLRRAHRSAPGLVADAFLHAQARVFGLLYLVVFPSFLPKLHALPHGPWLVLFLLLVIWVGDIGGYYGGKLLGKHKLSVNVSPGKTREGALAALACCALFAFVFHRYALSHLPVWKLVLFALSTSLVAQAGDLIESLMKRTYSVKDSGTLIPGHGGVFDRFDSLILAAPFFFLLVRLFA
jgi:phosphatidate cytidylyltransferase